MNKETFKTFTAPIISNLTNGLADGTVESDPLLSIRSAADEFATLIAHQGDGITLTDAEHVNLVCDLLPGGMVVDSTLRLAFMEGVNEYMPLAQQTIEYLPVAVGLAAFADAENGTHNSSACMSYLSAVAELMTTTGNTKDGRKSAFAKRIFEGWTKKLDMQLEQSRFVASLSVPTKTAIFANEKPESVASATAGSTSSMEDLIEELNGLIGLEPVKTELSKQISLIKVNALRAARGMPTIEMSNHLVFSGNPGTGKTTVARLVGKIYCALGLITSGHLVETDRSGLVAGYVGQTAIKTKEVAQSALGGVLFIDEAYTLAQEGQDFGKESIETLLKFMEDHRNDFVMIVAGYPDKMDAFLRSNPGLKSRFNKFIQFPDYNVSELSEIFSKLARHQHLIVAPAALQKVNALSARALATRTDGFGNARFIRNVFERAISAQACRLDELGSIDDAALTLLDSVDIPEWSETS